MNKYSMKKRQTITKDVILDKTLDFFISGNIAFNQADNPHFQALMAEIQVDGAAVVINRHTVRLLSCSVSATCLTVSKGSSGAVDTGKRDITDQPSP